MKLGRSYGEELSISSWWSSLAGKLGASRRTDFVTDMDTDTKKQMRSKTLSLPSIFLSNHPFNLLPLL